MWEQHIFCCTMRQTRNISGLWFSLDYWLEDITGGSYWICGWRWINWGTLSPSAELDIVFMDLNFNAKLLFSASVELPGTGDGATDPNVYWFSEFRKYKSGRRCQQLAPSPLPTVPLWHHSDLKLLLIIPCLLTSLRCLCLLRQHQVTMQLFSASEYRGMEVVWIQSIGQDMYHQYSCVVRLHTSVGLENSIVKYQC